MGGARTLLAQDGSFTSPVPLLGEQSLNMERRYATILACAELRRSGVAHKRSILPLLWDVMLLCDLKPSTNMTRDRALMHKILVACAKRADVKLAEVVIEIFTMLRVRPNRKSYCTMVRIAVTALNPEKAALWLQRLFSQGLTPPLRFLRVLLSVLNQVLVRNTLSVSWRQSLLKVLDTWLVFFVAHHVPICRPSRKLLLGHFSWQFWKLDVGLSKEASDCIASCVHAARDDIFASMIDNADPALKAECAEKWSC